MIAPAATAELVLPRLLRPSLWVGATLALFFVVGVGFIERRSSGGLAADHVLSGAVFGIAFPLLALAVMERLCHGGRLDTAVDAVARHGANRRAAVFSVLAAGTVVVGALGVLLSAVAVLITHRGDPGSASLLRDLATSAWVAIVGSFAYTACLGLASLFGRAGGGRRWFVVLDWLLGSTSAIVALPWPRGHVRNLLGAEPVMGMAQWAGLAWLAALTIGAGFAVGAKTPR